MTRQNHSGRNLCTDATSVFHRLLAETGYPPSLEEVASALDVLPSTMMSVFRDGAHLMEVAVESALLRLHDRCIRSMAVIDGADPIAQLEALADAYIGWAIDHPGVFLAFHSPALGALRENDRFTRFERSVIVLMQRLLVRAKKGGLLAGEDNAEVLAELIRALICGALHKVMLERLPQGKPDPEDLAEMRANLRLLLPRLVG